MKPDSLELRTRPQRAMFLLNRRPLAPAEYTDLVAAEAEWIGPLLDEAMGKAAGVVSFEDFRGRLRRIVEEEAAEPPPSAVFLAREADRKQFKTVVDQFAVDGLTEAQSFLPIVPRLPIAAQMPVMRVLIDEFGCGNLDQMHTNLYCRLLEELGSPLDLDHFVGLAVDEVFEFVNVFHWMTKRSPDVEYFLGALAWFEAVVPAFFAPYVEACERLKIESHHYYSEHVHIDVFHARDALHAIREAGRSMTIDPVRLWAGVLLINAIAGRAFDASVDVASGARRAA